MTLLRAAARLLEQTKGEDIVALDLTDLAAVCDYFLIASGGSELHVHALAEAVEDGLRELGYRVWHREGATGRRWLLLDYVDVVIHIFHRETRDYYRLENLWGDAKRVPLDTRARQSEAS
jgi:ribosome-associated protein